jgi:hypothetical protein
MFGRALQEKVPSSMLIGYELKDFNLRRPADITLTGVGIKLERHAVDVNRTAYLLNKGIIDHVNCAGFFLRMDYYESNSKFSALFNAPEDLCTGFDERHLVINVRSGDIMRGIHVDYAPLPINYYRYLVYRTGLLPVFMGQIDESEYVQRLQKAFPDAIFIQSQGALKDFETIRRSKNIAIPISTFSWLAAWFSEADNIYLPIYGAYNPNQRPDVDLLPVGDMRYKFCAFPVTRWRATSEEIKNLFEVGIPFEEISHRDIGELYQIRTPPK